MGGRASGVEPTVTNTDDADVKTVVGDDIKVEIYHGKVLLVVNIATHRGVTPQLIGLWQVYVKSWGIRKSWLESPAKANKRNWLDH
jgi:glutathione peroxidase-family protein